MRLFKLIILVILGVISLTACNFYVTVQPTQNPEPVLTLDYVRTEAVQTVEFELTESATSEFTSTPPLQPTTKTSTQTATVIPATPIPSATATPTETSTSTPTPTATVIPSPTPTEKSRISFLGVEKDRAVRVLASNFPPDQVFTIRVGPFKSFAVNNVTVGTLYSDDGGSFEFTILLPFETFLTEEITVRLDSPQNSYAYNAFTNQDSGSVIYGDLLIESTLCDVSVDPDSTKIVEPLEHFDVIWTIKNVSDETWDANEVDYKWLSGIEMQIYAKVFDLPQTVKPDETVTLIVDVRAPETAGTYTTQWAVVNGRIILCHLPLTVNVEEVDD